MRSLLIAALISTGLFAGNVTVGADLLYSDIKGDMEIGTLKYLEDTTSFGARAKLGYKIDKVKLTGFYQIERYKDDMILKGEGNNITYGAFVDYSFKDAYVGFVAGRGERDLNNAVVTNSRYNDLGLRAGIISDYLEVGVNYVNRDYDNVVYSNTLFTQEDRVVGFYVGFNFEL